SRLDYLFVSTPFLSACDPPEVSPCPFSDHDLVSSALLLAHEAPHGPGAWRLDTVLLSDEPFIEEISHYLESALQPTDNEKLRDLWDTAKLVIADKARHRLASIRWNSQYYSQVLHARWRFISHNPPPAADEVAFNKWLEEKERLKSEYADIITRTAKRNAATRCANWIELGERPTSYFFKRYKIQLSYSHMESVRDEDGVPTATMEDTLRATRHFYERLYSPGQIDQEAQNTLIAHL
ncbi:hypothetical protein SYNPS1DRAFT_4584, partial [Syncephalis pseudoplumigaleata]